MGLLEDLLFDYNQHKKARTQKHAAYPQRFFVPENKVAWQVVFANYSPVEFNAPIVLNPNTPWADPQDIRKINREFFSFQKNVTFSDNGFPQNPVGRTGICGRGVLGKWGANFAVDGIITTLHPVSNLFLVLAISRKDSGEIAFPGGMVDSGEDVLETRNRELAEELSIDKRDLLNPLYEKIAYQGYIDDPRNTDNAWLESTAIHTHLSYPIASKMNLSAGDDAKEYHWIEVTKNNISNFYANHGLILLIALNAMLNKDRTFINQLARNLFLDIK